MKFEEALKVRREQVRSRSLEMQRKRIKKERRKETVVMAVVVIGFIVALTLAMKLGQDAMGDCMSAGHSKQYCEKGL